MAKDTGLPLVPGLDSAISVPHTISYAVLYRRKINSFAELPEDKQPPRNLWDKPYKLSLFFDEVFERKGESKPTNYVDFNYEDVE
jgi:hypothetical protein